MLRDEIIHDRLDNLIHVVVGGDLLLSTNLRFFLSHSLARIDFYILLIYVLMIFQIYTKGPHLISILSFGGQNKKIKCFLKYI